MKLEQSGKKPARSKLGICQWFHYRDYDAVELACRLLDDLGVRHLRTGISWADDHRPDGRQWYAWMLNKLRRYKILLSIWHTPPSIAEGAMCSGPPRRLEDFAEFIWRVNDDYGDLYQTLELWNEPNNRLKWNFPEFDPGWSKFARMVAAAAAQSHRDGKPTVLGGMIPVDHHWLQLIEQEGALEHVDVIAIHAFPEMWWEDHPNWDWSRDWHGWRKKIGYIAAHAGGRPIWVTETGLATLDLHRRVEDRFELQVEMLRRAAAAPTPRLYWYSLIDLDPRRDAIEGFHVDENEYHMGLTDYRGNPKPAYYEFQQMLAAVSV